MDQKKMFVFKLVINYDNFFEEDDIENLTVQEFLEHSFEPEWEEIIMSRSFLSSEYGKEYAKELEEKEKEKGEISMKLDENDLNMPLLKYLGLSASYCKECDSALNPITRYCSLCEIQN